MIIYLYLYIMNNMNVCYIFVVVIWQVSIFMNVYFFDFIGRVHKVFLQQTLLCKLSGITTCHNGMQENILDITINSIKLKLTIHIAKKQPKQQNRISKTALYSHSLLLSFAFKTAVIIIKILRLGALFFEPVPCYWACSSWAVTHYHGHILMAGAIGRSPNQFLLSIYLLSTQLTCSIDPQLSISLTKYSEQPATTSIKVPSKKFSNAQDRQCYYKRKIKLPHLGSLMLSSQMCSML